MLTLYAFFLFALSSPVIAAPSGHPVVPSPEEPYAGYKLLMRTEDSDLKDLKTRSWGRMVLAPWAKNNPGEHLIRNDWYRTVVLEPSVENAPQEDLKTRTVGWTDARNCDDFIRFIGRHRVKKLTVRRIQREIVSNTIYRVFRSRHAFKKFCGAKMKTVYPSVPQDQWPKFLNDTWWGRAPGIVDPAVSNGVMF